MNLNWPPVFFHDSIWELHASREKLALADARLLLFSDYRQVFEALILTKPSTKPEEAESLT